MGKYFDRFPKMFYDIAGNQRTNYQYITDIFFRLRIIRKVLNNISGYYVYTIQDGDTPEILAEKVYKDPEAHWIILLANNIVDPHYDWPLSSENFNNYIIGKYGSIETAQITYHHYDKVIVRDEQLTGIITTIRLEINQSNVANSLSETSSDLPFDTYDNLADEQSVQTYNLSDNRTVVETVYRERISYYDYENELNEAKRNIKIIKPEYYPQIMSEFNNLLPNTTNKRIMRKLV